MRPRRLDDERRDELKLGSNHFGEQAARAFLDGALDVALGSSDRAIRDHEALLDDDPDDREVRRVLADRLRDRVEFRRYAALVAREAGRDGEATTLARAGVTDGERAVALYEEVTDEPGRFPLWVPSVRLLLAELYALAGDPGTARRQGEQGLDAYRRWSEAPEADEGPDEDEGDDRALDHAHALLRLADVLATSAPSASLAHRRSSVDLVRRHARVDGALWRDRRDAGPTWASVPTWRRFARSAHDLAVALAPPRAAVAAEALLALQDAVEGYAALAPASPTELLDPQVRRDTAWLGASVRALATWLDVLGGGDVHGGRELAAAYEAVFARHVARPGPDAYDEFVALRPRLARHLA